MRKVVGFLTILLFFLGVAGIAYFTVIGSYNIFNDYSWLYFEDGSLGSKISYGFIIFLLILTFLSSLANTLKAGDLNGSSKLFMFLIVFFSANIPTIVLYWFASLGINIVGWMVYLSVTSSILYFFISIFILVLSKVMIEFRDRKKDKMYNPKMVKNNTSEDIVDVEVKEKKE